MKRYLYIFIAVAGLVLVGLAAYYFLTSTFGVAVTPSPTPPSGLPGSDGYVTPGTPPPAGEPFPTTPAPVYTGGQKFGVIAENQVAAYHVDSQNNVILVQPDGQVAKITNGNATMISTSAVTSLIKADFSPAGSKIAITFGNRSNPQVSIFDVISKSWQPLPAGIHSPAWSPTGTQIMYFRRNGDVNILSTLDISKATAKPVEISTIHLEDRDIQWLAVNQALFLPKNTAFVQDAVWSFDVKNKTLAPLTGEQWGVSSLWSSAVNMGLVFTADQTSLHEGKLTIFDTLGKALSGLLIKTLPSKCAFSAEEQIVSAPPTQTATTTGQTGAKATSTSATITSVLKKWLYCAVPRDAQKFGISRLPDDYNKRKLLTIDDFYKIDLAGGGITEVFADPAQALDATNLQVVNQTLFFVNRYDQKLYAISLK